MVSNTDSSIDYNPIKYLIAYSRVVLKRIIILVKQKKKNPPHFI
jgi:hypothetical protein